MFCSKGIRPSHYEFIGFKSWEDYLKRNQTAIPALFSWVGNLIGENFSYTDLDSILKASRLSSENSYIVGRVSDCRNIEFNRVVLINDIIENSDYLNGSDGQSVSHIYTGISRAKNELYLPQTIYDWVN